MDFKNTNLSHIQTRVSVLYHFSSRIQDTCQDVEGGLSGVSCALQLTDINVDLVKKQGHKNVK